MTYQPASTVILIILVCAFSTQFGRERRRSGRPVTPRDALWVMAWTWALGWVWIGLPALADWGRRQPRSELVPAILVLLGFALAAPAFMLAATSLPRLFGVADPHAKKPTPPDTLD
jgi:hypothetical protein